MERMYFYKLIPNLVIVLFLSLPSYGQTKDNYLIYSSLKGNLGNYIGGGITLDVIRNNKYSLGIGYFEHVKKPGDLPSDYQKGVISLVTFGLGVAQDNMQSVSFTLGRVIYSKSNSLIRYNIKGGIAYSIVKTPTNWVRNDYVYWGGETIHMTIRQTMF